MEYELKLGQKLNDYFKNYSHNGLSDLLKRIQIKDNKNTLEHLTQNDLDLVWYPGCGGDISPCSVLEDLNFELANNIEFNENRLYFFIDPGSDHPDNEPFNLCRLAYGGENKIYDLSKSASICDYIEFDNLIIHEIFIGEDDDKLITGYFIYIERNAKSFNIIYLKMPMENFSRNIVKLFDLNFKWMFFIQMNTGWDFIQDFSKYDIRMPQWICAERPFNYDIDKLADLQLALINDKEIYHFYKSNVYYGKTKTN